MNDRYVKLKIVFVCIYCSILYIILYDDRKMVGVKELGKVIGSG